MRIDLSVDYLPSVRFYFLVDNRSQFDRPLPPFNGLPHVRWPIINKLDCHFYQIILTSVS